MMMALEIRTSNGILIGIVGYEADSETFSFTYDKDWIALRGSYPISPAIAFDAEIKSSTIKKFIENLLPEGEGLTVIAQSERLSKSNIFALINAVGKESTGGLMIVPPGFDFSAHNGNSRLVSNDELSGRIRSRDTMPFSLWDGKVRLSIAGYQDKLAVLINNGKMYLAEHPQASTHIIKPLPRNPELSTVVANEYYCLSLAGLAGVSASTVHIRRVPEPVLIVERFDRKFNQDLATVERLHVIDACQLLDMPPSFKYERNFGSGKDVAHIRDGVSLKKIFDCRHDATAPIRFSQQVLQWVLFQYLVGNSDAHGKNLSFFVNRDGKISISPTYDIVSTVIYNGLEDQIALSVGDEFRLDDIRAYQWALFAEECKIPRKFMQSEMIRMAKLVAKHIDSESVDISLMSKEELSDIRRIQEFMLKQCSALTRDALQIMDVTLD